MIRRRLSVTAVPVVGICVPAPRAVRATLSSKESGTQKQVLRVQVPDRDGEPATGGEADCVDTDDPTGHAGTAQVQRGRAQAEVPVGTYACRHAGARRGGGGLPSGSTCPSARTTP